MFRHFAIQISGIENSPGTEAPGRNFLAALYADEKFLPQAGRCSAETELKMGGMPLREF